MNCGNDIIIAEVRKTKVRQKRSKTVEPTDETQERKKKEKLQFMQMTFLYVNMSALDSVFNIINTPI